jgi:hypothetical protein
MPSIFTPRARSAPGIAVRRCGKILLADQWDFLIEWGVAPSVYLSDFIQKIT